MSTLKPKGQGAMLLQEQTGVVLSAKNQPAVALLLVRVCSLWSSGAPVGTAWRDSSPTGWGDLWGEMFWLWLSAHYAGIQAAQHVGEITGLQEGERGRESESDHPPFNTMWPGLLPGCGQLKSEPVMHICALFFCCSILLRYAQRATNKAQFHLVPISPTETSLPAPPPSSLPPCGDPFGHT